MISWRFSALFATALGVAFGCFGEPEPARLPDRQVAKEPPAAPKIARKLFLLGVDGADWALIDPLLEAGKLPNFARLIERGTRAPLKTYTPTASPLIWTTIATGMPPERHGIGDFAVPLPGTNDKVLPTSNMRRVPALWNIFSDRGFSVGVVGWWATYPAERVNGFVVSDQASALRNESYKTALGIADTAPHAADAETYPPGLSAEIKAHVARSRRVGVDEIGRFMRLSDTELAALKGETRIDVESITSVFKFAMLIDQAFSEAFLYGIGKTRPDFSTLYLNGLDAAEHHFFRFLKPEGFKDTTPEDVARFGSVIPEYYVFADEVLGRVLALLSESETTIVVVSDHGHHANPKYDPASKDHYNRLCSGDHEDAPDGILILAGNDVVRGAVIRDASVYDIAPTLLALFGAPAGSSMPGRVLEEAIAKKFLAEHPPVKAADYPAMGPGGDPVRAPMGDALKAKLKGLGYIE